MRLDPSRAVDNPEPGYFAIRLVKGGVRVAGRLSHDEDGRWIVEINGEPKGGAVADPADNAAIWKVWHGGEMISESEYRYLLERSAYAAKATPQDPFAVPTKPVDLRGMKPLF